MTKPTNLDRAVNPDYVHDFFDSEFEAARAELAALRDKAALYDSEHERRTAAQDAITHYWQPLVDRLRAVAEAARPIRDRLLHEGRVENHGHRRPGSICAECQEVNALDTRLDALTTVQQEGEKR
jgi:hypothetical protein